MPGQRHPGLDKSKLGDPVQRFYMMGLAESTHKLYACGVRRFMGICATVGRAPVPADEDTLPFRCLVGSGWSPPQDN